MLNSCTRVLVIKVKPFCNNEIYPSFNSITLKRLTTVPYHLRGCLRCPMDFILLWNLVPNKHGTVSSVRWIMSLRAFMAPLRARKDHAKVNHRDQDPGVGKPLPCCQQGPPHHLLQRHPHLSQKPVINPEGQYDNIAVRCCNIPRTLDHQEPGYTTIWTLSPPTQGILCTFESPRTKIGLRGFKDQLPLLPWCSIL